MAEIVVRFAPSPTGPPHLGNLRTALVNWLVARASGGRFFLRIDDTDRSRYSAEAEADMLAALRWLGLDWDEGPGKGGPNAPYRQSERLALYHQAASKLIESGHAYRPAAEPEVVRLRVPAGGQIAFKDEIRGEITFDYASVPEDPVLIKSDGYPTYHLASVVDDKAMGVTHVLRGEEWIPSTPIHLFLFEALGAGPPLFAHLPLVTDQNGAKISKRDPHFVFASYQEGGYLPAALLNYLALLGWHPGSEQELFTVDDLIAQFTLARMSRSPAAFDNEKLRWFNRQHFLLLSPVEQSRLLEPLIRAAYPQAAAFGDTWLAQLVAVIADEIWLLGDAISAARFAFSAAELTDEAVEALRSEPAVPVITALRTLLSSLDVLDLMVSERLLADLRRQFKESHGWGGQVVMFPLRAALTGSVTGPHLHEVLALLGKTECLRRLDSALASPAIIP